MSLVKILSGRKRESSVWEYFIYEEKDDKADVQFLMTKENNAVFA